MWKCAKGFLCIFSLMGLKPCNHHSNLSQNIFTTSESFLLPLLLFCEYYHITIVYMKGSLKICVLSKMLWCIIHYSWLLHYAMSEDSLTFIIGRLYFYPITCNSCLCLAPRNHYFSLFLCNLNCFLFNHTWYFIILSCVKPVTQTITSSNFTGWITVTEFPF